MERLLIIKSRSKEDALSPEFRYLFSYCVTQAQKAFDSVAEVIIESDGVEISLEESNYVLVLSKSNTLFSSESLKRMKEAIDKGSKLVIPVRLTSFLTGEQSPVYSLRNYERLERVILMQGSYPREETNSHLPVSLFSRDRFEEAVSRFSLSALLGNANLLNEDFLRAGIFHEFIDYYGEVREDILVYLPSKAEDILEVGCGRGLTGKLIQERIGCRVTGIEINKEAAKDAAKNLWRVIVGDVRTVPITDRYDAVVATELFEHLNYPEEFLERMKSALKPDGRIVLSVPNVGHYSVVEDLIAGRWDYLPVGLLCYTHFRFFTRSTLEDWILRAKFSSYEIIAQTTELPDRLQRLSQEFEIDLDSLKTKGFYVILEI